MSPDTTTYLTIPIGKGCVLRLTPRAYAAALARGKAWRRATTQAEREAKAFANREAARLAWTQEGQ